FTQSGAGCLGRPQPLEMKDATTLQWAIATARRSPLGHHPDSFIYSGQAQFSPASSVAVAYRMSVFEKVGTFDENFDAAEDVEMNTRIDAAGLKCWFEPAIAIRYEPRKTVKGLAYQVNRYGRGRVRLWRKHRHTASLKTFAPGFCTLGAIIGLFLCIVAPLMPPYFGMPLLVTIFSVFALYLLVVLAESARLAIVQKRPSLFPGLIVAFFTIHFGYGFGILRELFFPKHVSG
ncbi:MAG: hypothetical protein FWE95_03920, partial [Planctomycetaceae bacterium]|nr:hypothetical protein [Planctomycetaceae bacterium]